MFAAQQHNCCVTWWHFRFYSVTIYRFFGGCDLNASLKALQYVGPFPIFKKCSGMKHIQVSVSVWTSMQFTKSLHCLIEGKSLCCLKIQGLNTAEFWRLVSLQRTRSTSACVVYQTQVCCFSSYHVELHSAIKPLLKIEQIKVDFWKAEKEMNKKKYGQQHFHPVAPYLTAHFQDFHSCSCKHVSSLWTSQRGAEITQTQDLLLLSTTWVCLLGLRSLACHETTLINETDAC